VRFEDQLAAAGLRPRDVVPDGRWHRCPTEDHPRKKNGVWKLAHDGRIGWWRNWATDAGLNVWRDSSATHARPIDPAVIRARREKERQERRRAIAFGHELWGRANRFQGHAYLRAKGLSAHGCTDLRVWHGPVHVDHERVVDDWLLVPMFIGGQMVNVQRISALGIKRQLARAPQVGATFQLGPQRAAITVLCEGLATGLAVYQCMRHARVIVCFYADNFSPVIDALRPTGSVVIAADNDWRTAARGKGNPGIEKALNAAQLIDCGVAWPEGIEGSDWADALKEWGAGAARRIEREIQAKARYVMDG
jgi:putative DNA primase/helicase